LSIEGRIVVSVTVWSVELGEIQLFPVSPAHGKLILLGYVAVCLTSISRHGFLFFSFQGFDEYMNLVLDAAAEVDSSKKTEKRVGRILLKVCGQMQLA
jgi:hypothetical protein